MAAILSQIDSLIDFIDNSLASSQDILPGLNKNSYRVVVKENDKGGPEKLRIEPFNVSKLSSNLQENEILIEVKACGINFIDTYHRNGLYPNPSNRIGKEGSGIIIATGKSVNSNQFKPNDMVCWYDIQGSYSTHVITTNNNLSLIKIPSFLNKQFSKDKLFNIAGAIPLQCLTCHYLCCDILPFSKLSPSTTPNILVHAGAGGCGGIIIQILKNILKIPNVITTVSTKEKSIIAKNSGADHVIIYTLPKYINNKDNDGLNINLKNDILKCCINNFKCNIIFDGVGKSTWKLSLECCQKRGLIVYYGNASGKVPNINPLLLAKQGSVMITRPSLKDFVQNKNEMEYRMNDIFNWIQKGLLNINIGSTFSLNNVKKAHEMLEARKTVGKILLIP